MTTAVLPNILIGIATCKRPKMLRQTLISIEQLEVDADVRVFIAENDVENREGERVVRELLARGYRFPISCRLVAEKGFTYAREAALTFGFVEISADFVAFVDDDQWVEPGWLAELLAMQRKTGAEMTGSNVQPEFETSPPSWTRSCPLYYCDTQPMSGAVEVLLGDAGVLISRKALDLVPLPWYDHVFALSGGADSDVMLRLRQVGAVFALTERAVVHEVFPESRLTLSWALSRFFRLGGTFILIDRKHHQPLPYWLVLYAKIAGALILYPPLSILCWPIPALRVHFLAGVARNLGRIAGIFSKPFQEYRTIHGS